MIVIDAADREYSNMYDAHRTRTSQSQSYVSERILFSGNVKPTITHILVGKNFLHLTSELE